MSKEEKNACECPPKNHPSGGGVMGGAYGLAFIGAVIYFIQHADTFWMGVYGVLKAMIWPAILAYKLLEYLRV